MNEYELQLHNIGLSNIVLGRLSVEKVQKYYSRMDEVYC